MCVVPVLTFFALLFYLPATGKEMPYLCQRQGHMSTVVRDMLYLYGGYQDLNSSLLQNSTFSPLNPDFGKVFYAINISKSWNKKSDHWQFSTVLPSNATEAPADNISGGALFRDDSDLNQIYQYGGAPLSPNENSNVYTFSSRSTGELRKFDLSSQVWASTTSDANLVSDFNFSQYGTFVQARDQPLGLHFDIPGMTIMDASSMILRHAVTNCSRDGKIRIGGLVQYIPNVGRAGVVVVFGGSWKSPNQTSRSIFDDLAPMKNVQIIDIGTINKQEVSCYDQNTSGRTPDPRTSACVGMATAPDNSSYNIYMYGGRSSHKGYAEMWVLSIPQFRWTKVAKTTSPIFGHTCNVLGSKQMLMTGGSRSLSNSPLSHQTTPDCLLLFDMTSLQWSDTYIVEDREYHVPKAVVEVIGGNVRGNASMTRPETGFSSKTLAEMFDSNNQPFIDGSPSQGGTSRLTPQYLWVTVLVLVMAILSA